MVKPVNNSNIITLNKCIRVTVEDPGLHSIRVAFAEVQVEEVTNKPTPLSSNSGDMALPKLNYTTCLFLLGVDDSSRANTPFYSVRGGRPLPLLFATVVAATTVDVRDDDAPVLVAFSPPPVVVTMGAPPMVPMRSIRGLTPTSHRNLARAYHQPDSLSVPR